MSAPNRKPVPSRTLTSGSVDPTDAAISAIERALEMASAEGAITEKVTSPRYEDDYLGWAEGQVALLLSGRLSEIDAANIAEELGDMARSEARSLESALRVLVMHMLKWDQQPELRTRSWELSIREQRRRIVRQLGENPSLAARRDTVVAHAYENARGWAAIETHLLERDFPRDCPYDWVDLLERPFEAPEPLPYQP